MMKEHTHNGHCEACSGPRYFKTETKEQIAARNEEMHRSILKAQAATEAHQQAAFRRVEESEKRKQAAKVQVFLIIGVFFDGTGNNASNTAAGILCGASAHWNNPVTQKHGWGLKVLYFNAPTENGVRVQHPHVVRWQP